MFLCTQFLKWLFYVFSVVVLCPEIYFVFYVSSSEQKSTNHVKVAILNLQSYTYF